MKIKATRSFPIVMMSQFGGGSVQVQEGSEWTVLATVPCPEEFLSDYLEDDGKTIDDSNVPDYYVIWDGKVGLPVFVEATDFEVIG